MSSMPRRRMDVDAATARAILAAPVSPSSPPVPVAAPPNPQTSEAVSRAARSSVVEGAAAVARFTAAREAGRPIPPDLRTYQRDEGFRMAWPASSRGGDRRATRCNVFAYNMAYQSGFALPTTPYRLPQPGHRDGVTFDRVHDVLNPAALAAPFDRPGAPDRRGVRNYFQPVEGREHARPGDWVLYQNRNGSWSHVDVVQSAERRGDAVRLTTVGAGSGPPNDMYTSRPFDVNSDGTLNRRNWQRVMILRPSSLRPADERDPSVRAPQ